MYPILSIGTLTVPTFSLLLLLAFATGGALGARQALHLGYEPDDVWAMLPWAAVGGILGAKLYYLIGIARGPEPDLLAALLGSGMVWYGGAVGGLLTGAWRLRRTTGAPLHQILDFAVPCVAAAHAVGRIGCFVAGDDWGLPSDLPWAVAFPEGSPPTTAASVRALGVELPTGMPDAQVLAVHPTQLYEAAGLTLLAAALWRACRRPSRPWTVFAGYLAGYGALRFGVELLRVKDDRLAIGLTVAQLISLALLVAGAALWGARRVGRASASRSSLADAPV